VSLLLLVVGSFQEPELTSLLLVFFLFFSDTGIIKTLDQPVYLTRIKGKVVHCIDRNGRPRTIDIDPTEYRFKLALSKENYDEVLQIIRNSNLVGQSIIAYLQKKGHAEIALHFVQDPSTRFDLAIECGNLDVALEMARAVEKQDVWKRLAAQALKQGSHKVRSHFSVAPPPRERVSVELIFPLPRYPQIVEIAYQKTKNLDRLSFLYLATGNEDRLRMMQAIAGKRGDQMSRFHNSLYLGDVTERVSVLREVGMGESSFLLPSFPSNSFLTRPSPPLFFQILSPTSPPSRTVSTSSPRRSSKPLE